MERTRMAFFIISLTSDIEDTQPEGRRFFKFRLPGLVPDSIMGKGVCETVMRLRRIVCFWYHSVIYAVKKKITPSP
jgi:hypothetical protein